MKNLYLYIFLLATQFCFSQNINFIIQVNDRLLNQGEIANLYFVFGNEAKKYYVNYYPGDLILDEKVLSAINSDTLNKFYLHFDYYTYKKDNQQIANFDIEFNKSLLQKPYLIANVFDFRDKKYKHWYQWITKEEYLVQLTFPNSGLYIRKK
jgi:hypothetical protein